VRRTSSFINKTTSRRSWRSST